MVTYCQKTPAQEQGQSEFPDGILIQDLQASLSEVALPQWCLSIYIFQKQLNLHIFKITFFKF